MWKQKLKYKEYFYKKNKIEFFSLFIMKIYEDALRIVWLPIKYFNNSCGVFFKGVRLIQRYMGTRLMGIVE